MRITIRRVREEKVCERQEVPYERLVLLKESVPAGGQQLGQIGSSGVEEACYLVTIEDDVEVSRSLIDEPITIKAPIAEIIYTGPVESLTPVDIVGRLSYINHGDAWTIVGNTKNKQALTADFNLDSLVFHQHEDGSRLLFSRESDAADAFFNELWIIGADGESAPQRLTPGDVLYAEWRPGANNTLAYSTGESSAGAAGWKALNNLWLMTIDPANGRTLTIEEALPESNGGFYGWWGTHFAWSPLGDRMAWARPDGFGLVDFERRQLLTLDSYAVFHSASTWVWLSSLSWSYDGKLLVTIVHGPPSANEPAETSPIFDVNVTAADGRFSTPLRPAAGMWAAPTFSPELSRDGGYIAWLQAREPQNSMNGEYDLMVADRDGSNQRQLFPAPDTSGIRKHDVGLTPRDFAWSPDARQIAIIYQGNLWLVHVETGEAAQVTFDGGSSNPVWTG